MITLVLIALILILLNALYVAAEFAVLGSRVSRVQQYAVQGSRTAAALVPIVASTVRLDTYIAVCQIGITLSSIALGAFGQATFALMLANVMIGGELLAPLAAHTVAAIVVLTLLTSTQVVFGELLPKTIALQYPVNTAIYTYLPMRWSHLAFKPLIGLLNGSGALILRRLGVDGARGHRHIHAPEEIAMLVRESREGGHFEETQRIRLQRTLRLSRRSVRQIMVPRRRIVGVDLDTPFDALLEQLTNSPYTRLVAYHSGLDQVAGYIHTKDVAVALAAGTGIGDLKSLVRPLTTVPSRLSIDQMLSSLRSRRARLALVVGPGGEVEGLVSIEDVMRELVGGLSDEFKQDAGPLAPVRLGARAWRMPGRLPLDELTEWARDWNCEALWTESSTETLAGYLIELIGRLPAPGHQVQAGNLTFTVESLRGVGIDMVRVEARPPHEGDGDG